MSLREGVALAAVTYDAELGSETQSTLRGQLERKSEQLQVQLKELGSRRVVAGLRRQLRRQRAGRGRAR